MDLHIDVSIVSEEVDRVFGKNGKKKLKMLMKNVRVYSHIDKLNEDIEIVADKLVFDELLRRENAFFNKTKSFNANNYNGEKTITEFGTIYSRSISATVKAVHGIKDEVFQYEVQLDSNGSICIGWATENCSFNDRLSGVGQTSDSYGFDGYTSEKWTMSNSSPYGKKWRVGNVIGCVIDFPKNTIEYFNNGRTLGTAFEEFNTNDVIYFPVLSLSKNECVTVNLGERPFKFPVLGAKPIIHNSATLIDYYKLLEKKISILIDSQITLQCNTKKNQKHSDKETVNKTIGKVLFLQFMKLLEIPYIVDYCFVSFLNNLRKKSPIKLKVLLELMWKHIPDYNMICIINQFMFCLNCDFKCFWREKFDISYQIMVLNLITALCEETYTRKQMIANILFNKIKFSHFLHIVSPSDDMLNQMIPIVYCSIENIDLIVDMENKLLKNFPPDYKLCKSAYENSCDKIKHLVNELEKLQLLFLKTLLNDDDQTETQVSSRVMFCRQFQSFVQENMIYWRNDSMLRLPGPVLLSTLFRLLHIIHELWNEELTKEDQTKINQNIFYSENYNFFGIDRVGGLFSYLRPKYQEVIQSILGYSLNNQSHHQNESESSETEVEIIEITSAPGLLSILNRIIGNADDISLNNHNHETISNWIFSFDHLPTDKLHILSLLLNNAICLYNIAGHKQLNNYMLFKDRLTEFSLDYATVDYELRTSDENIENQEYLEEALKNLEKHIQLTSRHLGWLTSMIFVEANETILEWILAIISHTLKYCLEYENELFRFVPEFYIDSMVGLDILLPEYLSPSKKLAKIDLAISVAETQLRMFGDNRIIHPKSKESIVQGIIMYLINSRSVEILQEVPEKSRLLAIQSILKDEWGVWNKISMMLMLIWHGSGFAFRYTRSPHLERLNINFNETWTIEEIIFTNFGSERPPASVLQNDIRTLVANDKEMASQFINDYLKYLNVSFSDFIILLHEINDINENVEVLSTSEEFHKLKLCSNRFILTVTLLRVIEMMVSFDRNLIMDQEGSLNRVFQLICQILNRINSSTSTFQKILRSSLPFVICIHKFTILMATMGILLSILDDEIYEKVTEDNISNGTKKISSIPDVTDVLISDPNFNLSSLEFIILPESENEEVFSLNSYKNYLTEEELNKVAVLYHHLDWYMKRHKSMASSINEDDLCVICYSKKNSVTLKPCGHQCCKLCADHHILYSKVCFYCKTRIEQIVDSNTLAVLNDFGSEPPPL